MYLPLIARLPLTPFVFAWNVILGLLMPLFFMIGLMFMGRKTFTQVKKEVPDLTFMDGALAALVTIFMPLYRVFFAPYIAWKFLLGYRLVEADDLEGTDQKP